MTITKADWEAWMFLNLIDRYLTGFTLFLSLILNRTFFMILDLLKSEEKMEIVKKQVTRKKLVLTNTALSPPIAGG